MSAGPFSVQLRNVTKRFGASTVLNDLNLEVGQGEKLVVIGPSGSGKSTLLRVLMTLEGIDRGSVSICGRELWSCDSTGAARQASARQTRTIRSDVGMVFQSFNLFPHLTALENVTEGPIRVLKMPKEKAVSLGKELLRRVGLEDRCDYYPARMSGGQQQRVAIARAMAMRPKILLFDEVTSALDPELVGEVLAVIRELTHQKELTVIMVTHQMSFAREIADRVCFFDHGRIVEEGEPYQFFSQPKSARTQAFLKSVLDA
ncbi:MULTISPECIES: ectoine/hydroxyectoine ABC transporter ATP-binding protein EhuA [Bradyrhizobium]|nr:MULTISPECIES: ectoine/hydroxyectoine ABC transporter ATP-binding protein EhuA [Bradyrhizobium]MCG2629331.1 ectoine/hydroxyectoine ABC transporter ATP-binding protein EhuA [Bradyrhizobium zhengyangense]MCG2644612.1 ectoine/hydroxyectoine ABC transporter ATP-binding protein EhuA [Bradyrhizobium zhengyangense]MCG2670845.1 ectoine/hydroxyectoine ABC transporter ATP-binding protein EhuA [Bradyrhizobium zhengyangense]MDN4984477.1 ectoine/hydroxyectoine ABC transporter ATP-binding protein EhuA [Bra